MMLGTLTTAQRLRRILLFLAMNLWSATLAAINEGDVNVLWQEGQTSRPPDIKYGWRLIILPTPGNIANTLVKRIDEDLNLTCTVEFVDDPNMLKTNVSSELLLKPDQHFKLSWHLPIMPQNSKNRVSFMDHQNSKQLIVEHLKESDGGEYECQAKAISDLESVSNVAPFSEHVTIRVKPKKGSCNEPSMLCSSGECIAKRFQCDGVVDCKDKSDEGFEVCGGYHPCEGKLKCGDGRCISPHWCCDRNVDKNCTVWVQLPCCRQLKLIQLSLETQFGPHQNQYNNDMSFLQTTIYTVIGCAMAFMFIITIMVIAICRVHLKRTAMSGLPTLRPRQQGIQFGDSMLNSPAGVPYTSASGFLVTYNINNGVQFMGRPANPPPYSESLRIPPREGPPPPYSSTENLSSAAANVASLNPGGGEETTSGESRPEAVSSSEVVQSSSSSTAEQPEVAREHEERQEELPLLVNQSESLGQGSTVVKEN